MSDQVLRSLTGRLLKRHLEMRDEMLTSYIEDALVLCESPIEKQMAVALMFANWPVCFYPERYSLSFSDIGLPAFFDNKLDENFESDIPKLCETVIVIPQRKIGDYRVDFMIAAKLDVMTSHIVKAVVECDGHDFHDRTKEQAIRDRQRDRTLQTEGYQVFRFTGREIYRDAEKCADEVVKGLRKANKRHRDST